MSRSLFIPTLGSFGKKRLTLGTISPSTYAIGRVWTTIQCFVFPGSSAPYGDELNNLMPWSLTETLLRRYTGIVEREKKKLLISTELQENALQNSVAPSALERSGQVGLFQFSREQPRQWRSGVGASSLARPAGSDLGRHASGRSTGIAWHEHQRRVAACWRG
jgi:hypothetical protein